MFMFVSSAVPPRLQPFYFPKSPELRKKVVVHCVVFEGEEPLTFSWYKDGRKLATNRNIHVKLLSETVTSLTLVEADASDIGNYTCEVSNVAGVDSVSSQFLITGEAPQRCLSLVLVVMCLGGNRTELSFSCRKNELRIVGMLRLRPNAALISGLGDQTAKFQTLKFSDSKG